MAKVLKSGVDASLVKSADAKVREIVEATLADIDARGDAAIRELSIKFDNWDRDDYRLTAAEIDACLAEMTPQDIKDIEFAQTQVRNECSDFQVSTVPSQDQMHLSRSRFRK